LRAEAGGAAHVGLVSLRTARRLPAAMSAYGLGYDDGYAGHYRNPHDAWATPVLYEDYEDGWDDGADARLDDDYARSVDARSGYGASGRGAGRR